MSELHLPHGAHAESPRVDSPDEIETRGWLPSGPLVIGLTAGASTPNNEIGATISLLLELRGHGAAA